MVQGGWGVDALIGDETRAHRDLDVAVAREDCDVVAQRLAPLGFRHDAAAWPGLPGRLVLADERGRVVDIHPLAFDEDGNGWQEIHEGGGWLLHPAAGLGGCGTVAGRPVRCNTPELQLRFREGYPWSDNDLHDVHLLAARFGVPVPPTS